MEYIDIDKLHFYSRNPRKIDKDNFENLKRSIKEHPEFFEARPVLCNKDYEVFAGNMRLRAAKELGLTQVPYILMDISKEKQDKLMLLDNRQAGKWDFEILGADFDTADLLSLGFTEIELGLDVPNNIAGEWGGMPEFDQQDKTAFRSIIVNFKTQEDVDFFADKLDLHVTDRTRFTWFPYLAPENFTDKAYATGTNEA